jgi:hypothetical protein
MTETIDIKALIRVSTFAKLNDRSAPWVHNLAKAGEIDMVVIDEVHFIRVNEKSRKYMK